MKKIIIAFSFALSCMFYCTSLCAQTAENKEEVAVLKKENPNNKKEEIVNSNVTITTEKMKNPNKKKEDTEDNTNAIITDQKSKKIKVHS